MELAELKKAQWQVKVGLRKVQQFAMGWKQLDLWKIHYTESKAVKKSPVKLGEVACQQGGCPSWML
jgi:hypothetical protein